MYFVLNICVFFILYQFQASAQFNYTNPNSWSLEYPNCGGQRQSPIDINNVGCLKYNYLNRIKYSRFDRKPSRMTVANNGHSLSVSFEWNKRPPFITGGPLQKQKYVFYSLHFHWGPDDESGSEHTFQAGTIRFPLEMHSIYYNSKYGSYDAASDQDDGLVVTAIFFQTYENAPEWYSKFDQTQALSAILSNVSAVEEPGSQVDITPFSLRLFQKRHEYKGDVTFVYTYLGSLTTPPCSETVTWIVFDTPTLISSQQLELFRSVQLSHDDDHNNRPVRSLNNRTIECSPEQKSRY